VASPGPSSGLGGRLPGLVGDVDEHRVADIERIEGFSAHADLDELLDWYSRLEGTPRRTYVIHGEEDSSLAFADTLRKRFGAKVEVPELNESFDLL